MDNSTMTVSYLVSPKSKFCCPWKRGTLILVTFIKKSLLKPSKLGGSSDFSQIPRASPIRFLKLKSKLSHCSTVSHYIFVMTLSSEGKLDLKLPKCLKDLPFGGVP